jgi:hypothetical protein
MFKAEAMTLKKMWSWVELFKREARLFCKLPLKKKTMYQTEYLFRNTRK